ncbi:MAG: PRC-barrel domain-containing protein, partial [Shinella sp.]
GQDHYPLPWGKLNYDEGLAGYRVDLTKEQVEKAPHYESDAEYDWNRRNGKVIHDYYGVPPYWM